jgi:hypothetical protein
MVTDSVSIRDNCSITYRDTHIMLCASMDLPSTPAAFQSADGSSQSQAKRQRILLRLASQVSRKICSPTEENGD